MRQQVAHRYRTIAPLLGLLANTLPLQATATRQPMLDALAMLDGPRGRRQLLRNDIDEASVPSAWRAAEFGRGGVEVDREAWFFVRA
ncbi:hypothetical protein ACIQC5_07850 [Paenarthrobacter sp. NPDC092416]|uniref:hypothetical protein n=1 Tax=Paenarthrobacter sp. NPDC092416 TaxID=3364386 RepID=UPI0037FCA939